VGQNDGAEVDRRSFADMDAARVAFVQFGRIRNGTPRPDIHSPNMNEIEAAQFSEEGPELAAHDRQGAGGAQVGKIHGRTPSTKGRRTPRLRFALGDRPVRFAPTLLRDILSLTASDTGSLRLQQDYTRGFNSSRIRVKRGRAIRLTGGRAPVASVVWVL
jgi:hypothetical protein